LNVFLNETCKDAMNISDFVSSLVVSVKDLEETARLGYSEGISKIFLNGLQELNTHYRPLHCSDSKREILYIKDQDKWEKEDKGNEKIINAIKTIAHKNMKMIPEWIKENPDYNDSSSKKNDKYLKLVMNSMSGSSEEEQKNVEKRFKGKFTGSDNAGSIVVTFNDDPNKAPTILDLSGGELDKHFEIVNKKVEQDIFAGHQITSPILFGIKTEGQLGGRSELRDAYEIFKSTYCNDIKAIYHK
jgi:hypothetical protein